MRQFTGSIGMAMALVAGGADWPQLRGPGGAGVAIDATPPIHWTETEGVKWKAPLPGPGSSSPIVIGDRVFVTCYSGYGVDSNSPGSIDKLQRSLVCVDRVSGQLKWTRHVAGVDAEDPFSGFLTEHGYASNTPASDGEAVYAFFSKSGVVAFSLDGRKLWQTSVGTGSDVRRWGSSASVLLYKNLVIINAASESLSVVALDKKTGAQVWKADGKRLSLSFSTPALVKSGDHTELVVAMPGETWGLNPDTGKLIWMATIKPNGNVCPGVIPGDGVVYVTGGFQSKATVALKVGGVGDVSEKSVLWSTTKSSYVPTPVLDGGRLMYVNEDGTAVCLKSNNGELVYEERLSVRGGGKGSRPFYSSPILADGRLYVVSRRAGIFVLKAGDSFEQIAKNPSLDDSDFNATPAVVGKQLFIRSNKMLYCLEDRQ